MHDGEAGQGRHDATAESRRSGDYEMSVTRLRKLHDRGLGEMLHREFTRRPVRRRAPGQIGPPAVSRLHHVDPESAANCNTPTHGGNGA